MDVTEKMKTFIKNGKIIVPDNKNSAFGKDPYPGHGKLV